MLLKYKKCCEWVFLLPPVGGGIRGEAASAAAETIANQLVIQLKLNPGTQELATDSDWIPLHEMSRMHAYCPQYVRCVMTVSAQHEVLSFFWAFLKVLPNLNEQLQTWSLFEDSIYFSFFKILTPVIGSNQTKIKREKHYKKKKKVKPDFLNHKSIGDVMDSY